MYGRPIPPEGTRLVHCTVRWCQLHGSSACTFSGGSFDPVRGLAMDLLDQPANRKSHHLRYTLVPTDNCQTALTVALVLLFLPFPLLKLSDWRELKRIDAMGIALVTSGTTILLLGLQFGGVFHPWNSAIVISLLAVGSVTLVLFVVQQKHRPMKITRSVMPVRIFSNRTAAACLSVSALHGFAYIVALYYIPIYFELVLDIGIFEVGLWLLLTAVPTTVVTVAAALLIRRTGRYANTTRASAAFLALGLGLCITFPSYKSLPRIVAFQLILAVGIGPLFQAPLIGLQAAVTKEDVSSAYATAIFLRTISSAIGLVIGQVILSNELRAQTDILLAADVSLELIEAMQRDLAAIPRLNGPGQVQQRHAVDGAVSFALSRVWVACTVVAGAGFVASCLIKDLPLAEESEDTAAQSE